jgi:hypothetical protein
MLDVLLGTARFRVDGLVDSGAIQSLFNPVIAEEAEIDLIAAEREILLVGPGMAPASVRFEKLLLEVGGLQWEAEVGFCEAVKGGLGGARDCGLLPFLHRLVPRLRRRVQDRADHRLTCTFIFVTSELGPTYSKH